MGGPANAGFCEDEKTMKAGRHRVVDPDATLRFVGSSVGFIQTIIQRVNERKVRRVTQRKMKLSLDQLIDLWMTEAVQTRDERVANTVFGSPPLTANEPTRKAQSEAGDASSAVAMDAASQEAASATSSEQMSMELRLVEHVSAIDEERAETLDVIDMLDAQAIEFSFDARFAAPSAGNVQAVSSSPPSPADAMASSSLLLDDLPDVEVEQLGQQISVLVEQALRNGQKRAIIAPAPRRKKVDIKMTVRKRMAANGGIFTGFCHKESPSLTDAAKRPLPLLVIADVSGSMGRYVAIVLYLLDALSQIAQVTSYIFSDTPTYLCQLPEGASFRAKFEEIRRQATSWEYGTRLNLALAAVRQEARYGKNTTVLLLTDGGFSIAGDDWAQTVDHLLHLRHTVRKIIVATPNMRFLSEGEECAARLGNVEHRCGRGDDLRTPEAMKIARFGLLARYSDELVPCREVMDIKRIIMALVSAEVGRSR